MSPLVAPLVDDLSEAIDEGKLSAGEKLPSIRQLAGRYNVTYTTARSALEHLERMGMVERLHGSGTYVRPSTARSKGSAESKVTQNIHLFGCFRPHQVGDMYHQLTMKLVRRGLYASTYPWNESPKAASPQVARLSEIWRKEPPRAVVLHYVTTKVLDELIRLTLPRETRVIVVDRAPDYVARAWHSVTPDYYGAFHMAAKHLIDRGHKRIGMVAKPRDIRAHWRHTLRKSYMPESQQILGAGHAMREAGLRGMTIHYNQMVDMDPGAIPIDEVNIDAMTKWLKKPNRPTGFVGDDFRLVGLARAAGRLGLEVGKDIEFVGVGASFLKDICNFPTISLQPNLIVDHLLNLIMDDERRVDSGTHHVVVPPKWVGLI